MPKKQDLEKVGNEIVEKQDRRKGQNSLWTGENMYDFQDTDEKSALIRGAITEAVRYWRVERVKNEQEAVERVEEYFNHCIKDTQFPTVEGLASALGVTRQILWNWETGRDVSAPMSSDAIKRAKEIIGHFDARMAASGKLNPVYYIFRSKNLYGFKDQQEYVITPNVQEAPSERLIDDAGLLPDVE